MSDRDAEIEDLRSEIAERDETIVELRDKINDLENDLQSSEAESDRLKAKLEEIRDLAHFV